MSEYVDTAPDPLAPLTAREISTRIFRKPAGWFSRDRVRKRLYARGFPHPMERGLWSAEAVRTWLANAGSNPDGRGPREKARRKRQARPNGYAPALDAQ
jgi:hypothetical protein